MNPTYDPYLAEVIKATQPADNAMRTGKVYAVDGLTVSCLVNGGVVDAGYLSSYAPAVGDTVAISRQDSAWLILGSINGSGGGSGSSGGGSVAGALLAAKVTNGNTTLASTAGAAVLVTKYSVTFAQASGHTVMVRARFSWGSTADNNWILVNLRAGTLVSSPTVGEFVLPATSLSFGRVDMVEGILPASTYGGGTRTVVMTVSRLFGSGTINVVEATARPGYIAAYDMGTSSITQEV